VVYIAHCPNQTLEIELKGPINDGNTTAPLGHMDLTVTLSIHENKILKKVNGTVTMDGQKPKPVNDSVECSPR
jgi:hypothetical protein